MDNKNFFNVVVIDTINEVEKEKINSLSDDGFFTYEWFKTLEISKPLKVIPRYIAVYEEDDLIAFAPCFIEYNAQYSTVEDNLKFIKILKRVGNRLGFFLTPPLVCYSPCSYHSSILLKKKYKDTIILNLITKKIDDICKKEKILFSSFSWVSEHDNLLINNLENIGYSKIRSIQSSYLDIQWSNFDDYVASLEKKVKKNIRREISNHKESGIVIEQEKDFGAISHILSEFHSNLFCKYNNRISVFNTLFYETLNEYMKDKVLLFIARKNNDIVGFSLILKHAKIFDLFIVGFNYENLTKTDFTYFNIVYYEPIKAAIEEGIERIHFRGGAKRIKQRRGCKQEKIEMFVKCHNTLLRPVLVLYMKIVPIYKSIRSLKSKLFTN